MAERRLVKPMVESSNLSSSAKFVMSEFDSEEIVINQYSLQTTGRIAPMVEQCAEAATVQVRILFRPRMPVWCNGKHFSFHPAEWRDESFNRCQMIF